MCTAIFALGLHPSLLFLLAFNREEYFKRESTTVHQWMDHPEIVAPKDVKRGGTWLGTSKNGRVSFLTNLMGVPYRKVIRSRGMLPVNFLTGTDSVSDYLEKVDLSHFASVNFFCGEVKSGRMQLAMTSSASEAPYFFQDGVHGISNSQMGDAAWYKVENAKAQLQSILEDFKEDDDFPWQDIFYRVLGDSNEAPVHHALPKIGKSESFVRRMTAMRVAPFFHRSFSSNKVAGTTSQTIIALWKDGNVAIKERSWNLNQQYEELEHSFKMTCSMD